MCCTPCQVSLPSTNYRELCAGVRLVNCISCTPPCPQHLLQNDCHFGTVACDVATTTPRCSAQLQQLVRTTTVARFMVEATMRQLYPYPSRHQRLFRVSILATFLTCSVCRFLCAFMHLRLTRFLHSLLRAELVFVCSTTLPLTYIDYYVTSLRTCCQWTKCCIF